MKKFSGIVEKYKNRLELSNSKKKKKRRLSLLRKKREPKKQ